MHGSTSTRSSRRPLPFSRQLPLIALVSSLGFSFGCGEAAAPPEQTQVDWSPATDPVELPRRAAKPLRAGAEIELASAEHTAGAPPAKGSAEWLLTEIARLRNAPLDVIRQPVPGRPGEYQQTQLTNEQAEQEQVRRHEKTVELAVQAISKSHHNPQSAQTFNNAVHYLSEARLQLALAGNEDQAQLLDENAEALFTRDATSFAAMDAAAHLVELTQALAERHARDDSQWALAFARQARRFAERFPQETSRAAVNVIAAGRLCEQLGLDEEAIACLSVIEQIAPDSPYTDQVSGSLRRLRLPGHPLTEFGGSTFEGGFTSIDQFRGQHLIVAFWASNSAEFRQHLPAIDSLVARSRGQLTAVGVNMDRDEQAVERFLQQTGMTWKTIFYSDPEKRGARNVVARHYGIINVPEYWLVDSQGIVRSIHLDASRLETQVSELLAQ